MVDQFRLIRKILSSSNGCELMNYGHRFVILQKYLYFRSFLKQRNFSTQQKGLFFRNKRKMPRKTAAPATFAKNRYKSQQFE